MLLTALLLGLSAHHGSVAEPSRTPTIAPRRPQQASRKLRSPTSRVRKWTIEQRICDRHTGGKCVTTAPDLVQVEDDKPR